MRDLSCPTRKLRDISRGASLVRCRSVVWPRLGGERFGWRSHPGFGKTRRLSASERDPSGHVGVAQSKAGQAPRDGRASVQMRPQPKKETRAAHEMSLRYAVAQTPT